MTIKLPPLDIKCTSSDCGNGLHCFRQTKKLVAANRGGQCRSCGADLVSWSRVHQRNMGDTEYTFAMLKLELIRHHFWHVEIDERAVRYAKRKGKRGLREATKHQISQRVGGANPFHDGFQTPKSGNPIYYAQHATASCCRTCMEEWHGIPKGRELYNEELEYLTELANLYIEDRMPYLTEEGEKVPRLRQVQQTLISLGKKLPLPE